jgi:hypothetical protein
MGESRGAAAALHYAAREANASEDEVVFDEKLKRIATAKGPAGKKT